MTSRWGATPEEWDHFSRVLGLTAHLLPVVSNPRAVISPHSTLSSLGKTPSLYNKNRQVIGIPKWTDHIATEEEIVRWSAEPDYGICIQTRVVRALDVDVTDPVSAAAIRAFLREHGWVLPERARCNSPKFLQIFLLPGTMPKRTMAVAGGVIEFLATGQQFVACGTHPSGVRYEWVGGAPMRMISRALDQFNNLWDVLELSLAVGPSTAGRTREDHKGPWPIEDDVTRYLTEKGLALGTGADGVVHVECPWKTEHTTPNCLTSTSYFAGGGFKCLHSHCAGRTVHEFLYKIGYLADGFQTLDDPRDAALSAFGVDSPAVDTTRVSAKPPLLHVYLSPGTYSIKKGTAYAIPENVRIALQHPELTGFRLSFDLFRDEILYSDENGTRPLTDEDYFGMRIKLAKIKMDPKVSQDLVRQAVSYVAHEHEFDSGIEWLKGLPNWDGRSRIETFYRDCLGCMDTPYTRACSLYQWTAMAGRLLVPGCQADMAPVWVSAQGTGKSSSVRAMVPAEEHYVELNLSDQDTDLSRIVRGKIIAELTELRGLRTKDAESIKAFMTRRFEEWIPKYKELPHKFPRRFIMIGTTNREDFLADETGNRRWLPVRVGRQDVARIERDRLLYWAEARDRFEQDGIAWQVAERLARDEAEQFTLEHEWEVPIREWLERVDLGGVRSCDRPYIRTWDILRDVLQVDARQANPYTSARVGAVLRKLGYLQKYTYVEGKRVRAWMKGMP